MWPQDIVGGIDRARAAPWIQDIVGLQLVKWLQDILGRVGYRTQRCPPALGCYRLFGGRSGRLLSGDAPGHYGFDIVQKEGIFPCKETI